MCKAGLVGARICCLHDLYDLYALPPRAKRFLTKYLEGKHIQIIQVIQVPTLAVVRVENFGSAVASPAGAIS
jgi:hypothetical protein